MKSEPRDVAIKLALGSTPKQASKAIVRDVIKTGLQPTVDSAMFERSSDLYY